MVQKFWTERVPALPSAQFQGVFYVQIKKNYTDPLSPIAVFVVNEKASNEVDQ